MKNGKDIYHLSLDELPLAARQSFCVARIYDLFCRILDDTRLMKHLLAVDPEFENRLQHTIEHLEWHETCEFPRGREYAMVSIVKGFGLYIEGLLELKNLLDNADDYCIFQYLESVYYEEPEILAVA